jgi:hypothetical protein
VLTRGQVERQRREVAHLQEYGRVVVLGMLRSISIR